MDANVWPPPSISCAFVKDRTSEVKEGSRLQTPITRSLLSSSVADSQDRLKSSPTLLDTIQTWVSEVPNLDKVLTGPVRAAWFANVRIQRAMERMRADMLCMFFKHTFKITQLSASFSRLLVFEVSKSSVSVSIIRSGEEEAQLEEACNICTWTQAIPVVGFFRILYLLHKCHSISDCKIMQNLFLS